MKPDRKLDKKIEEILCDFPKNETDSYLYLRGTGILNGDVAYRVSGTTEKLIELIFETISQDEGLRSVILEATFNYLLHNPKDKTDFVTTLINEHNKKLN